VLFNCDICKYSDVLSSVLVEFLSLRVRSKISSLALSADQAIALAPLEEPGVSLHCSAGITLLAALSAEAV